MAQQNNITIAFKGTGHKKLRNEIQAIAAAQERLLRETTKTNKSFSFFGDTTQRNTKRMGFLGNAFATVRSKMLLLNFAIGTLGVKALLDFSKQAAKVESMERAFNTLSGSAGKGAVAVSKLKVATNNTMSEFDLFQQANNAMVLGITKNSDEMAEMFDVAQRLGRALGRDTASSVESLITGIGRQSRLMLDNIGIIVKSDEAYKKYAEKIGTTADKLSDADKKTAFLEATMTSARAKVAQLGGEVVTSQDSFDAFSATISDLSVVLGSKLKGAFSGAMDAFVKFIDLSKAGDVEVALSSMNLDVMVTQLDRYRAELKRLQSSFAGRGAMSPELYAEISEQMSIASHNIANLETHVFELQRALMIIPAQASIFDLFPNFSGFFQTNIEVIEKANQESETLINDFYIKMHEAGLEFGALEQARLEEAARVTIENEQELNQVLLDIETFFATKRQEIRDKEEASKDKKTDAEIKRAEDLRKAQELSLKMHMKSAIQSGMAYDNAGKAAESAARSEIQSYLSTAIAGLIKDYIVKLGFFGLPLAAGAGAVIGSMAGSAIGQAGRHYKFEQGGMVGGRRHSQGGTMIEAEQGEYVMSRNAVNAIGVEAMNRINQGGGAGSVNISFSGNVMSQDFIENEAIPQIKEAIRRGADIGVS